MTNRPVLDPISWITPARWGFAATASTADLSNLVLVISQDAHWKHTASAWLSTSPCSASSRCVTRGWCGGRFGSRRPAGSFAGRQAASAYRLRRLAGGFPATRRPAPAAPLPRCCPGRRLRRCGPASGRGKRPPLGSTSAVPVNATGTNGTPHSRANRMCAGPEFADVPSVERVPSG